MSAYEDMERRWYENDCKGNIEDYWEDEWDLPKENEKESEDENGDEN